MPGIEQVPYLTNSTMMAMDFLPRHLVIIGGGYIGLEFGQMYRRFGGEVTIVEMGPRLIGHEDKDVSAAVKQILKKEVHPDRIGSECIHFTRARGRGGCRARLFGTSARPRVRMCCWWPSDGGRIPMTLGLEKAGVETDSRGYIKVDDELCTNVSGIWGLGDCNGRELSPIRPTTITRSSPLISWTKIIGGSATGSRLTALYIYSPLGRAGMTDDEILKRGHPAMQGQRPMTRVGRAVEKGETQGFMKITVDAQTKEILGAAILGVGGRQAIDCILDVMYSRQPYTTLQRAMHIHPTVSELLPTILGEAEAFGADGSRPLHELC